MYNLKYIFINSNYVEIQIKLLSIYGSSKPIYTGDLHALCFTANCWLVFRMGLCFLQTNLKDTGILIVP